MMSQLLQHCPVHVLEVGLGNGAGLRLAFGLNGNVQLNVKIEFLVVLEIRKSLNILKQDSVVKKVLKHR